MCAYIVVYVWTHLIEMSSFYIEQTDLYDDFIDLCVRLNLDFKMTICTLVSGIHNDHGGNYLHVLAMVLL